MSDLFSQPPPAPAAPPADPLFAPEPAPEPPAPPTEPPAPPTATVHVLDPQPRNPAEEWHAEPAPVLSLDERLRGTDLFGQPVAADYVERGSLQDRFVQPPFTVLDTRQGSWRERRGEWMRLGIKSEEGRDDSLTYSGAAAAYDRYRVQAGKKATTGVQGTSVFDPVLCELAYRWWCPPGGHVLDPFAGGSVRGIVAACLGLRYTGVELRAEQVDANREQARTITPDAVTPGAERLRWVTGDCREVLDTDRPGAFDAVFTCPPYGDLEVYSDDPADLSTMPLDQFRAEYARAIALAARHLAPDRFFTIVVGDYRDKRTSGYVGFVSETIRAAEAAGLLYYNEAILVNMAGTAPFRVSAQFPAGRKLGKLHQNVLVFVKGDWRRAASACLWPGDVVATGAAAGADL